MGQTVSGDAFVLRRLPQGGSASKCDVPSCRDSASFLIERRSATGETDGREPRYRCGYHAREFAEFHEIRFPPE